jgi:hypothetical protein
MRTVILEQRNKTIQQFHETIEKSRESQQQNHQEYMIKLINQRMRNFEKEVEDKAREIERQRQKTREDLKRGIPWFWALGESYIGIYNTLSITKKRPPSNI